MNIRTDALLFGESAGRIVISCARHHIEPLEQLAAHHGVPAQLIGRVGGSRLFIQPWIEVPVEELSDAWRTGLPQALHPPTRQPAHSRTREPMSWTTQ